MTLHDTADHEVTRHEQNHNTEEEETSRGRADAARGESDVENLVPKITESWKDSKTCMACRLLDVGCWVLGDGV